MIVKLNKECFKEYRCSICKKLLFIGAIKDARIEIKCRNCRLINKFASKQ